MISPRKLILNALYGAVLGDPKDLGALVEEPSCGGPRGSHTDFWRYLSWCAGDDHATRICVLVDLYCSVFKVDCKRFAHRPGGWR